MDKNSWDATWGKINWYLQDPLKIKRQVQKLLSVGINPNMQDENGMTALMQASASGQYDVVRRLLKADVNQNMQDKDGWTALMCAMRGEKGDIVQLLMLSGADFRLQDKKGWTAFAFISDAMEMKVLETLRLSRQIRPPRKTKVAKKLANKPVFQHVR